MLPDPRAIKPAGPSAYMAQGLSDPDFLDVETARPEMVRDVAMIIVAGLVGHGIKGGEWIQG